MGLSVMAPRRKLETLTDFQRALKQKYGLGEGSSYKPWLRVQDVKSRGNSGKIEGLKSGRVHHTLSEGESCFFYIAEFCDSVVDIREQFPLLPLDLSLKISKTIGVDHPENPQSKDPNIITTDFLLTCSDGVDTWYEAVSVKPEAELGKKRAAEKLDLERIWWELQGVTFHLFVMTELNKIQSENIQWFTSPIRQGCHRPPFNLMRQALELIRQGTVLTEDICDQFINQLGVSEDEALLILKLLIADKDVVIDLDRPVAETGVIEIKQVRIHEKTQQHAC